MKYNLRKIMLRAWTNYRKNRNLSFGECLHRAWLSAKAEEINQKRIEAAKTAAAVTEETIYTAVGKLPDMRFYTGARRYLVLN